jgi:hypothetical protein
MLMGTQSSVNSSRYSQVLRSAAIRPLMLSQERRGLFVWQVNAITAKVYTYLTCLEESVFQAARASIGVHLNASRTPREVSGPLRPFTEYR